MKISVVIPNYNGENLLKKNLPKAIEALTESDKYEIELILTDDASIDSSMEVAREILSKVKKDKFTYKILKNEKNLGFSSNVNSGVSKATGELLLLLNTDISPEKGFLEPLIKHFENKEMFAVGCMDKSIEGGKVVLRGRGIGSWRKGFLIHSRGEIDKASTLWVSGGSGIFRKEIWDALGGLDSIYNPFYWEDIDLSYRALKLGYNILFEPKSVVIHQHEKGAIKSSYSPLKVKTIAYRNQLMFIWKNSDPNTLLTHFLWLPYYCIKLLLRLDLSFFAGFFKAVLLLPSILRARSNNKKIFTKTDKEVTMGFDN
jgi:GT2 family glycosyltransferase